MSPSPAEQPFFEILADDVVLLHSASSKVADIEVTASMMAKQAEKGRFFVMVDFTGVTGGIDSSAREQSQRLFNSDWTRGCVYINASMPIRVALKVMNLALLLAGKSELPTEYVTSREEGLAAIQRMRDAGA